MYTQQWQKHQNCRLHTSWRSNSDNENNTMHIYQRCQGIRYDSHTLRLSAPSAM